MGSEDDEDGEGHHDAGGPRGDELVDGGVVVGDEDEEGMPHPGEDPLLLDELGSMVDDGGLGDSFVRMEELDDDMEEDEGEQEDDEGASGEDDEEGDGEDGGFVVDDGDDMNGFETMGQQSRRYRIPSMMDLANADLPVDIRLLNEGFGGLGTDMAPALLNLLSDTFITQMGRGRRSAGVGRMPRVVSQATTNDQASLLALASSNMLPQPELPQPEHHHPRTAPSPSL